MVANVYGKVSLYGFLGGVGVLVLFLPSFVSFYYRHILTVWWIYILTIYSLLAIAVTRAAFKDYSYKVKFFGKSGF